MILLHEARLHTFCKTTGAKYPILMLAHAFPAKEPSTFGTAGDGLARGMIITALLGYVFDRLHEMCVQKLPHVKTCGY